MQSANRVVQRKPQTRGHTGVQDFVALQALPQQLTDLEVRVPVLAISFINFGSYLERISIWSKSLTPMTAVVHRVPCTFSVNAILPSGTRKAARGMRALNVIIAQSRRVTFYLGWRCTQSF